MRFSPRIQLFISIININDSLNLHTSTLYHHIIIVEYQRRALEDAFR